jgi:hypothetical protein
MRAIVMAKGPAEAPYSADELAILHGRVRKLESSCACGIAAAAGVTTLGVYLSLYAFAPGSAHGWRHLSVIGLAWFFCGAIVGKALGLLAFRLQHRRLRNRRWAVSATRQASP